MNYSKFFLVAGLFISAILSCNHPDIFNNNVNSGNNNNNNTNNSNLIISNVQSSVLQYTNRIDITWNKINRADSYVLYRYESYSDNSPDIYSGILNNYFSDFNALNNTLYFYKVSCVENNKEYEKSSLSNFGIYSDFVDIYEPDNNINSIEPLILNETYEALIYSCLADSQFILTDTDWYLYTGNKAGLTVYITVSNGNGFKYGDIKFIFNYKGQDQGNGELIPIDQEKQLFFDNYDPIDTEPVNVNFKIYIDNNSIDKTKNLIGKYIIRISNEF